jgi:cyclic pyranopterin phosphate synthase
LDVAPRSGPLVDRFGRQHTYLRLSVTDRCNYRCTYCLPATGVRWLPKADLLRFEEIEQIARVLVGLGVRRIRLTGGEPTLRADLPRLVERLAALPGLDDLAMTTNGHAFAHQARALAQAGLRRVNVSIDALDPDRFRAITRGGDVARVLEGIKAALDAGLSPVKLNCVVLRGQNEDEVERLLAFAEQDPQRLVVRFIEYMPFDSLDKDRTHLPVQELRRRVAARRPLLPAPEARHGGPASTWRLADTGQVVGFISPITEHFCEACNRLRLSADGHLRTCLSREPEPSLRALLRSGADDAALEAELRRRVFAKVAGHEAHLSGGPDFEGVMTQIGG